MAEQPNDNYARHDHLHDDVYTPIPTFEDHANDQLKHGGSMVPDYSTNARRAIPIDTMSRVTPFTAPDNGIAVGNFAPPTSNMIIYAYINGIRTSFQSSAAASGYGHNRDCLTIPLKKGDTLWFGDADGNSKQAGYLDGVYYPHWFYPYVHAANSVNGQIVYNNQPIGSVCWFDLEEAPDGWVVCNGKWYSEDGKLSSDTYTEVCTIQTPNLIGRYALGATTDIGDTVEAGLPNITGAVAKFVDDGEGHIVEGITNGAFYAQKYTDELTWWTGDAASDNKVTVNFDASRSNAVYGNSDTVTPPSTKLLPCMKIYNNDDNVYMPVPDYGQTQSIMEFPHTCTKSGVVYLSWSIDYSYCVIPTVNGKRIMAFADAGMAGGYTSTFVVSSGDVIDLTIVTNYNGATTDDKPKLLDINGAGELQEGGSMAYITGSYNYVMYARFVPYKNQQLKVADGIEALSPIDYSKAIDVLDQYTVDTQGTLSNNGWSATGKGRVLVQSPTISGTAYGLFIKPFNSNKYIKLWQTDGAGPVNMFIHVADGDNIGIRSLNETSKTYSVKPVILTFFPND